LFALLAIEQAVTEFLAEGRGQAGDFSVACHAFPWVGPLTETFYHIQMGMQRQIMRMRVHMRNSVLSQPQSRDAAPQALT
jgi:hypothetical protein